MIWAGGLGGLDDIVSNQLRDSVGNDVAERFHHDRILFPSLSKALQCLLTGSSCFPGCVLPPENRPSVPARERSWRCRRNPAQ